MRMADNREYAKRGRLFIISAPSGAGKTSLVKALVASEHHLVVSVSYTTRPMRSGEQQGVDYHFVDDATFRELIKTGDFLEYAEVFDHCYGTSRSRVNEQLNKGNDVILEIDWQGAQQVRRTMPENTSIFILPPSRTTLEQRLRDRQQDSEQVITRRLQDAMTEISHYGEFDYVLVNDDFKTTLDELRTLLKSPHEDKKALSDNVIKVLEGLLDS
jgi:guanylate kinase